MDYMCINHYNNVSTYTVLVCVRVCVSVVRVCAIMADDLPSEPSYCGS